MGWAGPISGGLFMHPNTNVDHYLLNGVHYGKDSKKNLTEFSFKVGGWGQQQTNFPLIFFLKKA